MSGSEELTPNRFGPERGRFVFPTALEKIRRKWSKPSPFILISCVAMNFPDVSPIPHRALARSRVQHTTKRSTSGSASVTRRAKTEKTSNTVSVSSFVSVHNCCWTAEVKSHAARLLTPADRKRASALFEGKNTWRESESRAAAVAAERRVEREQECSERRFSNSTPGVSWQRREQVGTSPEEEEHSFILRIGRRRQRGRDEDLRYKEEKVRRIFSRGSDRGYPLQPSSSRRTWASH